MKGLYNQNRVSKSTYDDKRVSALKKKKLINF